METATLLDDVEFSKEMLTHENLSNADTVFILRNLLRMKYYPVAVKFFYSNDELQEFKANADYKIALRPFTLCHFVATSRQRGDVVLGTPDKVGCTNAKYVLGLKELEQLDPFLSGRYYFLV